MPTSLAQYTDEELIQLYQKQLSNVYFTELYKRYSMLVYGLCYKYLKDEDLAKDYVSEIFVLVLQKLKTHQISFFKSWLYMVSKNYLYKNQKKNNTLEIIDIENISEKIMENEPNLTLNIQEEQSELLRQAISNLNEEQRTCIELFYYKQKPYQEVASISGYDLNKVKSAIQNGKRNLKLFMEENKTAHEE